VRERRDAAAVDGGAQGEEDPADYQVQEQEERTPHQPHRLHLQQGRPSRYSSYQFISHVFGPPGSGSISHRYGSGSGSFYHHAKIVIKKNFDFLLFCYFLFTFYL
jgi:hypothetical protein